MDLRRNLRCARDRSKGFLQLCFALLFIIDVYGLGDTNAALTKIENWTEVTQLWPIEATEYFIAVKEGHHFIQAELPDDLSGDLDVELEYYYKFKQVKPTLQVVLAEKNIDVILGDRSQKPGKWLTHKITVKSNERKIRKQLKYNIILHDNDDVFAWKFIKITSATSMGTTESSPSTTQVPSVMTEVSVETTERSTEAFSTTTEFFPTTTEALSTTTEALSTTTEVIQTTTSGQDIKEYYQNDQVATSSETTELFSTKGVTEPNFEPTPQSENADKFKPRYHSERTRRKRWAEPGRSLICKPTSCEKNVFKTPRFMPIKKNVPIPNIKQLEQKAIKLFLNTHGQPLRIISDPDIKSDKEISMINPCFDLSLYMDEGTEMELYMPDTKSTSGKKTLEVIKRKPGDSGSNKWAPFKRCMSDYVPHLQDSYMNGKNLGITFEPRASGDKQIAILAQPKTMISLHKLTKPYEYLPNLKSFSGVDDFEKYWILDKDGVIKPNLKIETQVPEVSTSQRGALGNKVLHISDIDQKQDSFDITSRWIKVNNIETLENPLYFIYRAGRADWVKSVDFEFQSASSPPNEWLSTEVYVELNPISSSLAISLTYNINLKKKSLTNRNISRRIHKAAANPEITQRLDTTTVSDQNSSPPTTSISVTTNSPPTTPGTVSTERQSTTQSSTSVATTDEISTSPPDIVTTSASTTMAGILNGGQMFVPIKLQGLNSVEFRLRVKHNLKDEAKLSSNRHELTIGTLSFGDACAESAFCLNDGECRPSGAGTATCKCKKGYYGEHCDSVKPCEVEYDDKTGDQLCKSVGSTCIENLPVFRCVWPDDKYYQCKALYQTSSDGQVIPLPPDLNPPELLKERIEEQQRLIIILSVFMGALLLFSIVIIGNMITKLMRSKRRLKKAENDVHELTRRSVPGTSASSFGRLTGRNKAAAIVSYNNQAFDAD